MKTNRKIFGASAKLRWLCFLRKNADYLTKSPFYKMSFYWSAFVLPKADFFVPEKEGIYAPD